MKDLEYKYNLDRQKIYEKSLVENFNTIGNEAIVYLERFHKECGQYLYNCIISGKEEKTLKGNKIYERACFLQKCVDNCLLIRKELFENLIKLREEMLKRDMPIRHIVRRRGKEDIWWLDIEGEDDITKIESDEFFSYTFSIEKDGKLKVEEHIKLGKDDQ